MVKDETIAKLPYPPNCEDCGVEFCGEPWQILVTPFGSGWKISGWCRECSNGRVG